MTFITFSPHSMTRKTTLWSRKTTLWSAKATLYEPKTYIPAW